MVCGIYTSNFQNQEPVFDGLFNSGEWYHIGFTWDGEFIRYFVNGAVQGQFAINGTMQYSSLPLFFGSAGGVDQTLFGSLDDIAMYNRALTPTEITQLYTAAEEPVTTCAPLAPNLQNGLVGYWPFCGNANDESGNGNNGVVNGATLAEDRFGNVGSAYSFDGVDDYVTVEGNSQFEFMLSSSYTVNYWVNLNTIQGTQAFIGQGDGDGQYQNRFWRSYLIQDQIVNHIRGNQSDPLDTRNMGSSIADNSWFMVSMVRDYSNTLKLYANGLLVDSDQDITGIANSFNLQRPIYIGAFFNAVSNQPMQYCNGIIDDITIYNRALTPEEITQLYTGAAAPCNLIASETQDTPVEVGGSAQMYVTLNAPDYSMQWQTNAAGLGWMDVQDNNTYTGSQTQNLLISNASLANHEQPFRIIVTDGICNDTSDVAMLLVNNTCTAYDTITNVVEVFDTLTIENVIDVFDTTTVFNTVEVFDTLTVYNTVDVFDTTEVVVETFDTLTNVIDVFDTTTVYLQVDIFDTLFFDVFDTTYVVNTIDVYDTTYIQVIDTAYVTVTDTLLIDITFVGFEGQPSWLNTVLVYPNPTSDHITIDYGNFALMAGYNTIITDAAGATVYSSAVNTQQANIDINAWGAAGVYYMSIYDVNGAVVAVRQIVIQ